MGVWSSRLHLAVFGVLILSWAWPVLRWGWRTRWSGKKAWAPAWICPACGRENPSTRFSCEGCQEGGGFRFWRKLREAPWVGVLRKTLALSALTLRVAGGVAFYVLTFLAAYRFRFFSFHQKPTTELLAALGMLFLLAALYYFRRALAWKLGSPVARFTDLAAAGCLGGAFLVFWILWAAAPFGPGKPLASLSVTPDGVIRVLSAREKRCQSTVNPESAAVIVPVSYARWTWPLLQIDQTFVIKVGTQPVVTWMGGRIVQRLAGVLSSDEPQRPRLVVLRQVLEAAPPGRYNIDKARTGDGLVLERVETVGEKERVQ
ncbi:MAG: zinc finger Ran-binding domain-containing family 2 protein [Elusimicrobia bacterium]|nr:zinc finger Ran-binding domain-containing family 2 protein [Elusimicrobiota bacterium]